MAEARAMLRIATLPHEKYYVSASTLASSNFVSSHFPDNPLTLEYGQV